LPNVRKPNKNVLRIMRISSIENIIIKVPPAGTPVGTFDILKINGRPREYWPEFCEMKSLDIATDGIWIDNAEIEEIRELKSKERELTVIADKCNYKATKNNKIKIQEVEFHFGTPENPTELPVLVNGVEVFYCPPEIKVGDKITIESNGLYLVGKVLCKEDIHLIYEPLNIYEDRIGIIILPSILKENNEKHFTPLIGKEVIAEQ